MISKLNAALARWGTALGSLFTKPSFVSNEEVTLPSPATLGICAVLLGASLAIADIQYKFDRLAFYPPELLVYLFFVIASVQARYRRQLLAGWFTLEVQIRQAIGLILIGAVIGTVASPIFPASIGALKAWIIAPLLLFWLSITFLNSLRPILLVLATLAAILILVGGYELLQDGATTRLTGFYESPNYLAALSAPVTVVLCWYGFKGNRRLLFLGLLLLGVTALTKSLGAFAGIGLATVVTWFYLGRKAKIAVATVIVVLTVAMLPVLRERLGTPQNSLTSRTQLWKAGLLMGSTWPVTGAGLRGYEIHFPEFITKVTKVPQQWDAAQPHNFVLALWLGLGMFGLFGFILLCTRLLRFAGPPNGFQLALVAILGHGLVDTPYFRLDLSLIFWLYVAAIIYSHKPSQTEEGS